MNTKRIVTTDGRKPLPPEEALAQAKARVDQAELHLATTRAHLTSAQDSVTEWQRLLVIAETAASSAAQELAFLATATEPAAR